MQPRFYMPSVTVADDTLAITDRDIIRQITGILRLKKDDVFFIFTPQVEYELAVAKLTNERIEATVIEQRQAERESSKKLILYQSLLKKDKFEWILQKGVELGIHAFVPVVSDNSIIREISGNKLTRYQKIITEATEQCGGVHIAPLDPLMTFADAIQHVSRQPGQSLIAWEGQVDQTLPTVLKPDEQAYHLFIGPEGGYSPAEIELAKNHGLATVSLGRRILRAETASIAAAALILLE
ncbi:MAG: RsmE family RNA methyltransferase [Patescibacteria group bacterium]